MKEGAGLESVIQVVAQVSLLIVDLCLSIVAKNTEEF
jgi:hypothetical protein